MPISGSPIYLSTVLLEKNRANGKGPSLLVSDWVEPVAEAGYAGLEIWMNHLLLASRSEWDLIREKCLEADLVLVLAGPNLPVDPSDKSRRLRDAVLEACDSMRPEAFKFGLAGDPRRRESASPREALGFVKDWAKDVPKDVRLLSGGDGRPGGDGLLEVREILGGGRYQAALRPFRLTPRMLEEALETLGGFIGNLEAQARRADQAILLSENKEEHLGIIAATLRKGFKGTWTVESTKGVGLPSENIDIMFDNAEKDFNFLIEALAPSAER
jgi:hypothetical protein